MQKFLQPDTKEEWHFDEGVDVADLKQRGIVPAALHQEFTSQVSYPGEPRSSGWIARLWQRFLKK